jgi:SagB-type dehydrogenase family enzyme
MIPTAASTYQPVEALAPPKTHRAPHAIELEWPEAGSGLPLMAALSLRHSEREFSPEPLTAHQLGELLWAANGVNRGTGDGRTAPSAHGCHEIDIYAALPQGVYQYDAPAHRLVLKHEVDARNLTGYQDFVALAPLDLIYVINYGRLVDMPAQQRDIFAATSAGAMAQNVYLYCASAGLATVVRGWLNRRALADALGLNEDELPVLSQTVGLRPK